MNIEVLEVSLDLIDRLTMYDSLCVLVPEDERPLQGAAGLIDWRLCGALSRVLKTNFFVGAPDDKLLMPATGLPVERLFAIGLGQRAAMTQLGAEHALSVAAATLQKASSESVALCFPSVARLSEGVWAELLKRTFFSQYSGRAVGVFGPKSLRPLIAEKS